jgi:hypothetical protein
MPLARTVDENVSGFLTKSPLHAKTQHIQATVPQRDLAANATDLPPPTYHTDQS